MAKKERGHTIDGAIEQKEIPVEADVMGTAHVTSGNPQPRLNDCSSDKADMDDYDVDPLRKLQEARNKLSDLRNKLAGNDKLEDILNDVLNSTERLQRLSEQATRKEN